MKQREAFEVLLENNEKFDIFGVFDVLIRI